MGLFDFISDKFDDIRWNLEDAFDEFCDKFTSNPSSSSISNVSNEYEQIKIAKEEELKQREVTAWSRFSSIAKSSHDLLRTESRLHFIDYDSVKLKNMKSARTISNSSSLSDVFSVPNVSSANALFKTHFSLAISPFEVNQAELEKLKESDKIPRIIYSKCPLADENIIQQAVIAELKQRFLAIMATDLSFAILTPDYKQIKQKLHDLIDYTKFEELEKFCTEALKKMPRIVAVGILKAGKSTMMNCLVKNYENNLFKTGVVRTTIEEQIIEFNEAYFVDTPGIDSNDEDIKIAIESLKTADVILFTHNINSGGLDDLEIEFLNQIKDQYPSVADFINKTVIVLTHLDEKQDDFQLIHKSIEEQVTRVFRICPTITVISSTRYIKGMAENKKLLIEKSNYTELQNIILIKSQNSSIDKRVRNIEKASKVVKTIVKELDINILNYSENAIAYQTEFESLQKKFASKTDRENSNLAAAYENYISTIAKG